MQGEELEPARKKAEAAGVKDIFIDDLREEFVSDYVFPMFRCAAAAAPRARPPAPVPACVAWWTSHEPPAHGAAHRPCC